MTNKEWLNTLSDEELAKEIDSANYCSDNYHNDKYCCEKSNCWRCCLNWLQEKHEEPMPELKTGMFIKCNAGSLGHTFLGVIIGDSIVYQHDGWNKLINVVIDKIYNAKSFSSCDESTCIWKRDS